MHPAHHPLHNHRHLFFFRPIWSRPHIRLRMLAEGRRINPLDRLRQPRQPRIQLRLLIAQHERLIHAREWLILRILQQTRRPHRQRPRHLIQKRRQVVLQKCRQRRRQKSPPQSPRHPCSESQTPAGCSPPETGQTHPCSKPAPEAPRSSLPESAAKIAACKADVAQTPARAPFRPATPLPIRRKKCTLRLERGRVEIPNQKLALLPPVFIDRRNQILPQRLQIGKIRNLPRPQLLRHRKFRPRRQPARKMISLAVITKLSAGTVCSCASSEFMSLARATSAPSGIRKIKSPNAHCCVSSRRKSRKKCRRPLLQKRESLRIRPRPVLRVTRMQHNRHIRHRLANHMRQFKSRILIRRPAPRKLHIRHHRQQVLRDTPSPAARRLHNPSRAESSAAPAAAPACAPH